MTLPGGFIAGQLLLDRYELRHYVAGGGMGTVYRGWDTVLERDVALKRVTFTGQSPEEETDNRARTLREARLGAHLGAHPHIISIYDRQEIDGDVWLVMEYLESLSLAQITTDATRIDISEAARIGAAVADALTHAHNKGIIHRDVKPANILLSPDRRQVKLADFGIAHRDHDPSLTATNVVTGTIAYMPREVARGDTPGDSQSDIYSLGATLYEIVEGDTPHGRSTNANRLLIRAAHEPPRPPQHAGPFGPLLQQMLAPDPTTRPTAHGARRLLTDFAERHRNPTNPPPTIAELAVDSRSDSGLDSDPQERAGHKDEVRSSSLGSPGAFVRKLGGAMRPVGDGSTGMLPAGFSNGGDNRARARKSGGLRGPTRRSAIIVAGVALISIAVLLALFLSASPSSPPAVARGEPPVTDVGAIRDYRAADPCALFDPNAMTDLSAVRVSPGADIGKCRVSAKVANQTVRTDANYGNRLTEPLPVEGPLQNVGSLSVVRRGITREDRACVATIVLKDGGFARFASSLLDGSTPPFVCDIVNRVADLAVARLERTGVTYNAAWQSNVSMAGHDACEEGTPVARMFVPGLSPRVSGYANGSNCYLGDKKRSSESYMYVRLTLVPSGRPNSDFGQYRFENGKTIYTKVSPAVIAGTTEACTVFLVHREARGGGLLGATEMVEVKIEGSAPTDVRCKQATQVAAGIEARF